MPTKERNESTAKCFISRPAARQAWPMLRATAAAPWTTGSRIGSTTNSVTALIAAATRKKLGAKPV